MKALALFYPFDVFLPFHRSSFAHTDKDLTTRTLPLYHITFCTYGVSPVVQKRKKKKKIYGMIERSHPPTSRTHPVTFSRSSLNGQRLTLKPRGNEEIGLDPGGNPGNFEWESSEQGQCWVGFHHPTLGCCGFALAVRVWGWIIFRLGGERTDVRNGDLMDVGACLHGFVSLAYRPRERERERESILELEAFLLLSILIIFSPALHP
jgi:hypothetical protein